MFVRSTVQQSHHRFLELTHIKRLLRDPSENNFEKLGLKFHSHPTAEKRLLTPLIRLTAIAAA